MYRTGDRCNAPTMEPKPAGTIQYWSRGWDCDRSERNKLTNLGYAYRPSIKSGTPQTILKSKSQWVRDANGNFLSNVIDTTRVAPPGANMIYGNLPRNSIRFIPRLNSDIGLQKIFSLQENLNLQFRVEAFNWTNHPNWDTPNGNYSSSGYGRVTAAGPSRQIQFAIRLDY